MCHGDRWALKLCYHTLRRFSEEKEYGILSETKNFEDAQNVYSKLIKDDPTNTLARKRMITILMAQQKIPEAINELREYLKIFMSDYEAWNKLADLYLSECDYKHAAFCMEELILSNPSNHLYYQRYAEIKYTEGGNENLELARAYYSQACLLCPNNLRSLYGLLLTCSALDNHLPKSLKMISSTTIDNKLHNGPSSIGYNYATIIDDAGIVSASHHHHHPNNQSSRLNNNPMPSKQQQVSLLSSTEKNRQLAKWAAEQIRLIYMSASTNCASSSLSSTTCIKSTKCFKQSSSKNHIGHRNNNIRNNRITTTTTYSGASNISDNPISAISSGDIVDTGYNTHNPIDMCVHNVEVNEHGHVDTDDTDDVDDGENSHPMVCDKKTK
ncbi:unnamed protein product [Schistosoma turkestanicum]|nr:unnamed protein product [Schistosoma turkestanicum]